jgi:hypothetical protein
MKKETIHKIILITLLLSLTIITACSGMYQGRNKGCSEGDACSYYTGNRGILTFLDRPPTTLYYRTTDAGKLDANFVEFNVRLRNDGPSDSYGAVFFSGVGSETFALSRIDSKGERPVMVPRTQQACYLDLFNIGDLKSPGTWNFMANCHGASFSQYGDRSRLSLNFDALAQKFGEHLPWLRNLSGTNIDLTWRDGEITSFTIGTNRLLLNFGRSLMIIISGLDFESFGGASFYLQGDNPAFPGGDIDYKTFKLRMRGTWPSGQDYYHIRYNIRTCYAYTTFVSPMICIDPDPFSDESKVCRDFTHQIRGTQGAPIAVTNVRTTNTGREVILEMTIRNVGPGTVWDVGYLEQCSPYYPSTVRPSMKDVVYIGYAHIANRALDCGNTYRLRLDPHTREARLTCRYDLVNTDYVGSAYQEPLRMELWYGYEENIQRQLTVRKLN